MHAMSEVEFMAQIGWGCDMGLVAETLAEFLRSQGHHEVARVCERLEDRYQDRSDEEYFVQFVDRCTTPGEEFVYGAGI